MVTYIFCTRVIKLDILISNAIAWIVSVVFAYITNKVFVFNSKDTRLKYVINEFKKFVGCRILSGILELIIIYVVSEIMKLNDIYVKIITNIVVIILNFIFSKMIIFKKV